MMRNYFHSLFYKKNSGAEQQTHDASSSTDGSISFIDFTRQMIKENPLEFLVPASTVLVIAALCVGLSLVRHDTAHVISQQNLQDNHAKAILAQISDIGSQIQTLKDNPQNSAEFQNGLEKISSDSEKEVQALNSLRDDMNSQMDELKKAVNSDPNARQYLDAKELPFKVVAIDVIAQQPFASVSYDNHMIPMAVKDPLAGWTLVSADYATATAEFKNSKDQYVKVIVQG